MDEDKPPTEDLDSRSRAERISELFQQVCDLNDEQREALLNRACAGDAELRAEVIKRFIPVVLELPSAASQRIAVSAPGSLGTIDAGRPPPPVGTSRTGRDVRLSRRS